MIHKKMILGVLLVCLSVGVLSAEPPVSPWQALHPAMAEPSHFEVSNVQEEEYNDTPYEVTYPEAPQHQNHTDYPLEEELIDNLPFKIPFKMDKKQLAVSVKLLKEAVKPILKSKSLRDVIAYIDDSLSSYKADLETQMYVTLFLDSMQEIYEGKETSELNMLIKRIFVDMSDEETARTVSGLWGQYVSPALNSYLYTPMRNYIISPVRNYLYDPLYDFAERIETWMESSQRPFIDVRFPDGYPSWSERMNSYASRISNWASQARQGLEMARRMLKLQEESRACNDCGVSSDHHEDVYSVQ